VGICPAGAWCRVATNTAVKPVRTQDPKRSRLRVSATTDPARLPYEEEQVTLSV
jgi:hypothetical protein